VSFASAGGAGTIASNAVTTTKINNSAVTLAKIANASANSKLLGAGAAGSGSPYAEITLGTNLSMSGTTLNASGGGTGCTTSGASILYGDGLGGCSNVTVGPTLTFSAGTLNTAATVVAGTTQTVTSTQWNGGTTFRVTTAAQTLTLPVSSSLSVNGGLAIQTVGQSVTLAPNASDAINGGSTGASVTIASGLTAYVTTDGSGNISATPITAPGGVTIGAAVTGSCTSGYNIYNNSGVIGCQANGGGGGTVTSVGLSDSNSTLTIGGTPVTTSGTLTATLNLSHSNAWTATQTFAGVLGGTDTQSGTTYTLVAGDCGKTVVFTSATAVTVTIPASIVPASGTACAIAIFQSGAGQVAVNGTAVSAATLVSAHSYTKTFGQNAMIGLTLTTVGATATAVLSGDGA
jgi:hypothetical protein